MDSMAVENREIPVDPGLSQAAKAHPGGWVYDIDYKYPENQRVPPEAIRGAWESDDSGTLTGNYATNARYRPIRKQQPDLKPYMHAGALTNRDQWIVEIDPRGEHLFPNIPANMVKGWWYVDKNGTISNLFRPSSEWIDDAKSE